MGTIIILGLIYVVGYITSIIVLKKYAKTWDVPDYDIDDPTDWYGDDYTSNAQAYTTWAFFWPILGPIILLFWLGKQLVNLTKKYLEDGL